MTQVALVTGAAQGLGKSIAEQLLNAGYRVVISDRSLESAQVTATELDATGERVLALKLDVSRKADFEDALAAVVAHWGELQVVVNNAAMTMTTPVMQISPEEFDRVVSVNQRGTFVG